jgi:hypothetical protein
MLMRVQAATRGTWFYALVIQPLYMAIAFMAVALLWGLIYSQFPSAKEFPEWVDFFFGMWAGFAFIVMVLSVPTFVSDARKEFKRRCAKQK